MSSKSDPNYLPFVRVALDIIFAIASALGWRVRWLNSTTNPEEPKETRDVPESSFAHAKRRRK